MASRFWSQMSSQMSGMAAGDAGHVAEPAGGEAQQGGVLVGPVGGESHQARRGEVRHVADDGDHLVVALRRHRHHLGAERRRPPTATAAIVVCDVAAVGVSTHTAPLNMSASAPSRPSSSLPAIG